MSHQTDYQRLKDIREKNTEKFRLAEMPEFDPVTGKKKPFVLVDQNDHDIRFLLTYISRLADEVQSLEDALDDEDDYAEDDESTE